MKCLHSFFSHNTRVFPMIPMDIFSHDTQKILGGYHWVSQEKSQNLNFWDLGGYSTKTWTSSHTCWWVVVVLLNYPTSWWDSLVRWPDICEISSQIPYHGGSIVDEMDWYGYKTFPIFYEHMCLICTLCCCWVFQTIKKKSHNLQILPDSCAWYNLKKYQPYMSLPICYVHVYICAKVSRLNCLEFIFLHDKLPCPSTYGIIPRGWKRQDSNTWFCQLPLLEENVNPFSPGSQNFSKGGGVKKINKN